MSRGFRLRAVLLLCLLFVVALSAAGCGPGEEARGEVAGGLESGGLGSGSPGPGEGGSGRPNIVLISADDLDDQTDYHTPRIDALLAGRGTTFENAFVTDSLCCPSRATTLRGQYSHNHRVMGNQPPQGGFGKFRASGRQGSTVATWLDDGGYRTGYVGKYLNGYRGGHVPPGWDEWYGWSGNYLTERMNENGGITRYPKERYHPTDVESELATDYLERASGGDEPFFLYLAPRAPHHPATPAPRHRGLFSGESVPGEPASAPSFNERDLSDKPPWLRRREPLTQGRTKSMEALHRDRMRSMVGVDEMVGEVVRTLRQSGELDNTYIVFTSDNGHHLGEHRLPAGKWTAYEEDINVPLIVRGPGVPEGRTLDHMVLNNDLAPTFAEWGGVSTPGFVDGRPITPLLRPAPPPLRDWRDAFLVETGAFFKGTGAGAPIGRPRLDAVRTADYLYVEYVTGARELYDLRSDPHQLQNLLRPDAPAAAPETVSRMEQRLDDLRGCYGPGCRRAEG